MRLGARALRLWGLPVADLVRLEGTGDFGDLLAALQELRARIDALEESIERDRELGLDTSAAEADLRKLQGEAAELGAKVDAAGEQAEAALDEAGGAAEGFGEELDGAGKKGLDLGNVIETGLGVAGAEVLGRLADLAKDFAAAIVESTELIAKLQDRAEDLGRDDGEAAERIEQLNSLAADLGASLQDVGEAALEGERKLQGMGVGAGAAAATVDQLLRVTVSARGETDDFGDVIEALGQSFEAGGINVKSFVDELERRLPGAADIAAAKLGVTREGLGELGVISEELAAELLPALASELEGAFGAQINDRIEDSRRSMEGVRAKLAEITNTLGTELLPLLEEAAEGIIEAFDSTSAQVLLSVLSNIVKGIGEVLKAVGTLGLLLDTAFVGIAELVTIATEGVVKLLRLIPGMSSALADFDDKIDETQRNLLAANRKNLRSLADLVRGIEDTADAAGEAGPKIGADLASGFEVAAAAAEDLVDAVRDATADTVDAAREAAEARLKDAEALAEGLVGEERKLAEERIRIIRESIEAATDAERELVDERIKAAAEALEAVKDAEGAVQEVRAEAAKERIKEAEEAAERLSDVEREAAQVRIKIIENALDEILAAEEAAAERREELIDEQKDALGELAAAFAQLREGAGEGLELVKPEDVEGVQDLGTELEALVAEREELQAKPLITAEESERINQLGLEIARLRTSVGDLGQAGSDLQPLQISFEDLGVQFRQTIADMLAEGGALSELLATLGPTTRASVSELITGFVDTSEQVGSTEDSVASFGQALVGLLRGAGVDVPREVAEAFGGAAEDVGSSTADIAARLAELDAKAREAAAGPGEAAAAVADVGTKAGEAAEPTGRLAVELDKTAEGMLRIKQVREEGDPLEGIAESVSGENAEPLAAAAEVFERIGTSVTGLGEQGPVAATSIEDIAAALLAAIESGSLEDFNTAFAELNEKAPGVADGLRAAADPVEFLASIAPDAAEGIRDLGTAGEELKLDAAGEQVQDFGGKVEDAGAKAGSAEEKVSDLGAATGTSADEAGRSATAYDSMGTSAGNLAGTLETTLLPQLDATNKALDPKKVEDWAKAIEAARGSIQALTADLKAAEDQANATAEALNAVAEAAANAQAN